MQILRLGDHGEQVGGVSGGHIGHPVPVINAIKLSVSYPHRNGIFVVFHRRDPHHKHRVAGEQGAVRVGGKGKKIRNAARASSLVAVIMGSRLGSST